MHNCIRAFACNSSFITVLKNECFFDNSMDVADADICNKFLISKYLDVMRLDELHGHPYILYVICYLFCIY